MDQCVIYSLLPHEDEELAAMSPSTSLLALILIPPRAGSSGLGCDSPKFTHEGGQQKGGQFHRDKAARTVERLFTLHVTIPILRTVQLGVLGVSANHAPIISINV